MPSCVTDKCPLKNIAGFSFDGWNKERIKSVIRAIAIAWLYESEDELQRAINVHCLYEDKEEFYAASFMAKIIFALRHGATKKEVGQVEFISTFYSFFRDNNWQKGTGHLVSPFVHGMPFIMPLTTPVPYTML